MAGQTQLSRKLGSDNQIFRHDVPAKVKRSSFPFGRKRDFCLDAGMIVPIDLFETLPGDYFEVDLDYILKSFPLKVPPFTSYKVRTHWYYTKKNWLWKGALTYLTKGRSHSISLSVPTFNVHKPFNSHGESSLDYSDTPMSLSSFFGFAPGHVANSSNVNESCAQKINSTHADSVSYVNDFYGGVSLLPFMFYQKIYRLGYLKPNLLQDNKVWFPDDMSDGWRISYSKDNIIGWSGCEKVLFTPTPVSIDTVNYIHDVPSVLDDAVQLTALRYAMFEDDRFTTALPWSTRGQAPTIDISSSGSISAGDLSVTVPEYTIDNEDLSFVSSIKVGADQLTTNIGFSNGSAYVETMGTPAYTGNPVAAGFLTNDVTIPSRNAVNSSDVSVSIDSVGFDINDLRAKIALTVWQERNARCEGYYNEMVYQHFAENPRSQDFEPIYLGGTSDIISFSEVIQHDNSSSDVTAQGHAAGLGETRAGGHVFSFRSEDYGYIMGVMIIQPETVYNSKIEKLWLRKVQEDEYFPEYQGLGLQEVLKGELFPTGTSSDNSLFGYQERDTEYKTRDNQAIGFFALPHTLDRLMSAYSQCREFTGQPSLSQQFVTMSPENMRKDMLAVPSMPFFRCSLATRVHAVRPMAYKNVPNTFGF